MPSTTTTQPTRIEGGLERFEALLRHDLAKIDYPKRDWVIPKTGPDGKRVLDVLILGGGQSGLAVAYGLMRNKVNNILVVDKNPEDYAGPWKTFARMITLRTPKYVIGPDHNIPGLTFQSWYEAQYGEQAWDNVDLIPKELWCDYLNWYKRFLKIPYQSKTEAGAITWNEQHRCFEVPLTLNAKTETRYARKIVYAVGIDGSGEWHVPDFIKNNLDASLYAHTRHDIDFEKLKGKRVGIMGAGASAFDNASVALETGAGEVHLLFRRKQLPNVNPYRWAEFTGFLNHHSHVSDADKWRMIHKILEIGQLPPTDTFGRATQNKNFYLHANSGIEKAEQAGSVIKLHTASGIHEVDFLIIGTGFVTNLGLRPELSNVYPHIALWSDRYTPPKELAHGDLSRHPYLGPNFELTEKTPGEAPYLSGIFNYTFGCLLSLGFGGASISGMKYSLPKIVGGITQQLYTDDYEAYFNNLVDFDLKEFEVNATS